MVCSPGGGHVKLSLSPQPHGQREVHLKHLEMRAQLMREVLDLALPVDLPTPKNQELLRTYRAETWVRWPVCLQL